MSTQYAPVFEREGNRLIFLHESFVADTEEDAWKIGLGASLVECVLYGVRPTHESVAIVDGNIPHFPAKLGQMPIALISGPMFDEYTAPLSAEVHDD